MSGFMKSHKEHVRTQYTESLVPEYVSAETSSRRWDITRNKTRENAYDLSTKLINKSLSFLEERLKGYFDKLSGTDISDVKSVEAIVNDFMYKEECLMQKYRDLMRERATDRSVDAPVDESINPTEQELTSIQSQVIQVKKVNKIIGQGGGMLNLSTVPDLHIMFPEGALIKQMSVGLQVETLPRELVTEYFGNSVFVSPIVTLEPRRRKFHKPVVYTMPFKGDSSKAKLLCSLSEKRFPDKWENIQDMKTVCGEGFVSFTSSVSGRFWLMDPNVDVQIVIHLYEERKTAPEWTGQDDSEK